MTESKIFPPPLVDVFSLFLADETPWLTVCIQNTLATLTPCNYIILWVWGGISVEIVPEKGVVRWGGG